MRTKLLAFILSLVCTTSYANFTGTVIKVSDGDTVTVLSDATKYKVRLYGIDAPEKDQEYGVEATYALAGLILGSTVTVVEYGFDQYRRVIGVIMLGDKDINMELLRGGHVWCYRQYNKNPAYVAAEEAARDKKVGLWGTVSPQSPWEYRKAKKNVRK